MLRTIYTSVSVVSVEVPFEPLVLECSHRSDSKGPINRRSTDSPVHLLVSRFPWGTLFGQLPETRVPG